MLIKRILIPGLSITGLALAIIGCAPPGSKLPEGVLRTPDARFEKLAEFSFPAHYLEFPYGNGAIRMHYLDEGPRDAPVILCLHGQGQWSYAYRHMIPLFVAAGYRVVAPDFIGFGRSDKLSNDEDYEFADHVEWLTGFIRRMDLSDDVTGFFYDWGGYFGLRIAAEHPELFDRLVLANTLLPRGSNAGSERFKKWRAGILARPEFPMAGMVNDGAKTKLTAEVMAAYDAPFPDESYKAGPRRFPMIVPIEDTDAAAPANKAAWEQLASFEKPTLTLYSSMFGKSPALGPGQMIEHIPGARGQPHALIEKAGFFIVDDAGEELAEKTLAFLQGGA